jgi:hypothetical protein
VLDEGKEEARKRKADYNERRKEIHEAKKAAKLAEEIGIGFSGDKAIACVEKKMKMTAVKETTPESDDDEERRVV